MVAPTRRGHILISGTRESDLIRKKGSLQTELGIQDSHLEMRSRRFTVNPKSNHNCLYNCKPRNAKDRQQPPEPGQA